MAGRIRLRSDPKEKNTVTLRGIAWKAILSEAVVTEGEALGISMLNSCLEGSTSYQPKYIARYCLTDSSPMRLTPGLCPGLRPLRLVQPCRLVVSYYLFYDNGDNKNNSRNGRNGKCHEMTYNKDNIKWQRPQLLYPLSLLSCETTTSLSTRQPANPVTIRRRYVPDTVQGPCAI